MIDNHALDLTEFVTRYGARVPEKLDEKHHDVLINCLQSAGFENSKVVQIVDEGCRVTDKNGQETNVCVGTRKVFRVIGNEGQFLRDASEWMNRLYTEAVNNLMHRKLNYRIVASTIDSQIQNTRRDLLLGNTYTSLANL